MLGLANNLDSSKGQIMGSFVEGKGNCDRLEDLFCGGREGGLLNFYYVFGIPIPI